jgi:hypothetical protein
MKKLFLFILIAFDFSTAQVDTTDWFPMQTGNYWEFMAVTLNGPKYFSVEIIDDTLMPNGKSYSIFYKKYFNTSSNFTWYFRKDSNIVYAYFGDTNYCSEREYIYLNFSVPDSTIWLNCAIMTENARGIVSTFYDNTYYNFLNKSNEAKQFEDV